jgi:hypothetical protein
MAREAAAAEAAFAATLSADVRKTIPSRNPPRDRAAELLGTTEEAEQGRRAKARERWHLRDKLKRRKHMPRGLTEVLVPSRKSPAETLSAYIGIACTSGTDRQWRVLSAEQIETARLLQGEKSRRIVGEDGAPARVARAEVVAALDAAHETLGRVWISILIESMTEATRARLMRNRNRAGMNEAELRGLGEYGSPGFVLAYAQAELLTWEGVPELPAWIDEPTITWLLDHYTPGGHGRGTYDEAGVRRLLADPRKLARAMKATGRRHT